MDTNTYDAQMRTLFEVTMGWRSKDGAALVAPGNRDETLVTNIDGSYRNPYHEAQFQGYKLACERIGQHYGTAITKAIEQMLLQREKGLKKYGAAIEVFQGTPLELAQHAFEESCDQTVYLSELVARLKKEAGL